MDTFFSQVQQFNQGFAQLWQDQIGRWDRATEAAFAVQRAWLEQCHELYSRVRGADDTVTPPAAR